MQHLCQFEPSSVLHFLETSERYRVERCLELCQKYRVADATAFLLERIGNVRDAIEILLQALDAHLSELHRQLGKVRNHPFSD